MDCRHPPLHKGMSFQYKWICIARDVKDNIESKIKRKTNCS